MKYKLSTSMMISIALLVGCTSMEQPTEEEVLQAINKIPDQVIKQGLYLMEKEELYNQFAVKFVRRKLVLESATINGCISAKPQKGYRCDISVATGDVPILGGLSFDLQMRFNKEQDGWQAYIN